MMTFSLDGRIDSNNAAQVEQKIMEALEREGEKELTLDAEKLTYISSAGLRVLMKLHRLTDGKLTVVEASPEVYEILEMTGFTEVMNVKKAYRKISIEGLPVIGKGQTGTVYRLDKETMVKVFRPNVKPEVIQEENIRTRNAFLSGVPTAISFDVVKVGDCYGSVYELLDAEDFVTVLLRDKAHLEEHVRNFAKAIRKMHEVEVDPERFPSTRAFSLSMVGMLEGVICTGEEVEKFRRLYESIPERGTFLHGDCHVGNVMVQNGELLFVDLLSCGSGHPVFDLGSMCSVYHLPPKFGGRQNSPLLRDFTEEESALIWNVYLSEYLGSEDEAFLKKAEKQISAVSCARTLFLTVFMPGLLTEADVTRMKKTVLDYVDEGLEPICF